MRILLGEPDSATAQSLELMLKCESFNIYTTDLGEEIVDLAKLYDYDIILMETCLPDMSGYEVLRTLRLSNVQTPVMILSGMSGVQDKVRALGFGADDYMTKPFHKDEVAARIQAIVRRSKGHAQAVITTGPIQVNLNAKTVEVDGQNLHLTGKEYQMLELLSLRKGMTLTKGMFLNHIYGGMDEPEEKIIDVFIAKIRKKLNAASESEEAGKHIETVWGRGYVLRDDHGNELAKTFTSESKASGDNKPAVNTPKIDTTTELDIDTELQPETIYKFGNFEFNATTDLIKINGKPIRFTEIQKHILSFAIDNSNSRSSFKNISKMLVTKGQYVNDTTVARMQSEGLATKLKKKEADIAIHFDATSLQIVSRTALENTVSQVVNIALDNNVTVPSIPVAKRSNGASKPTTLVPAK